MTLKVYVKTFGCSSNMADSAAISGLLQSTGFEPVSSLEDADAVVVNTCTVRKETELKVLRYLKDLEGRRHIVVTGCMAEVQPSLIATHVPNSSIVSNRCLRSIPDALRSESRSVVVPGEGTLPDPLCPASFESGVKYTVAISQGCPGKCAYCIARLARGQLRSVPPKKIAELVEDAVKRGAWEIRLSAQDACAYGMEMSTDLPSLLNRITGIVGDFRVRVGMFNPSSARVVIGRLVESFRSAKVYKFLHIPLQSGSDSVLQTMKRQYNVDDFRALLSTFRASFPSLTLFTDVIVGYPGETEDDFKATVSILKDVRPDKTHIARFSPRPHTPASSMRQLQEDLKKQRSERLSRIAKEIQLEINEKWIGRTVEATIVDSFKHGGMVARSDEYKTIAIKGCPPIMLGRRVSVFLESVTPSYLQGRIIRH